MTNYDNNNEPVDPFQQVIVSTEDKLNDLINQSRCAGCPNLAVVLKEAVEIDELRKQASDPEVFSDVESAFERLDEFDNPNVGLGFVGPDFFVGKKLSPEDSASTGAGGIINSILDIVADREAELVSSVSANIDRCPGKVSVKGHDESTRQVYDITVCSLHMAETADGLVPSFVQLNPDV